MFLRNLEVINSQEKCEHNYIKCITLSCIFLSHKYYEQTWQSKIFSLCEMRNYWRKRNTFIILNSFEKIVPHEMNKYIWERATMFTCSESVSKFNINNKLIKSNIYILHKEIAGKIFITINVYYYNIIFVLY